MGRAFKIFLGIFLVLIFAFITSLYFKKPQKPEVVEINPQQPVTNTQIFSGIRIEKLKIPTQSKPLIPYEENLTSTFSTLTTSTATQSLEITSNSTPETTSQIEITAKEFEFIPKEIRVKAKVPILIVFKNEGSIPFDLKISNEDFKIKFDLLPPKQQSKLEVEFPKPGIYEFFTTVPIGIERNMKGKIIAE